MDSPASLFSTDFSMASVTSLSPAPSSAADSIEIRPSPFAISELDSSPAPSSQSESQASGLDGPSNADWNQIDWKYLPYYTREPHSKKDRSWWWSHGFKVRNSKANKINSEISWLCLYCIRKKKTVISNFCFVASGSGNIKRHLSTHGLRVSLLSYLCQALVNFSGS